MTTRIHLSMSLATGECVTLPQAAFHHLVQVLKLRAGEPFIVFDGSGGEYHAALETVGKREATLRVGQHVAVERESPLLVTLAQCVSKGERMDFVLQKACELGVTAIQPLLSGRSVVKLDESRWQKKLEHWQGVLVAACEQCGRTRIPALHPVQRLDRWLALPHPGLRLCLAPDASASLRAIAHAGDPITLLIGPEGGLADTELRAARGAGFETIGLGPRVLRTETAGVAALAAIQALWGDLR